MSNLVAISTCAALLFSVPPAEGSVWSRPFRAPGGEHPARTIYGRWLAAHFEPHGDALTFTAQPAMPASLAIAQLEVSSDTAAGHFRQSHPVVARSGADKRLVFWVDEKNGVPRIHARTFDRDLSPTGSEFQLFQDGLERYPDLLAGADDGRVAALSWLNREPYAIRTAFVDSVGAVILENTAGDVASPPFLASPSGAALPAGPFVTVWEEFRLGFRIVGQLFDSAGTPLGGNLLLDGEADSLLKVSPAVAGDTAGGFLVAWSQGDETRSDVYVRCFDSLFNPVGSAVPVTSPVAGESYMLPTVAYSAADHRYRVAYVQAGLPADSTALHVCSIRPDGTLAGAASALPAGPYPWSPQAATSAARTVIFTERYDNLAEIRALAIDGAGVVESTTVISSALTRERTGVSSSSGTDTLAVVWQDRLTGEFDIHGLTRAGAQTVSPEHVLQSESAGGQQTDPDLAARLGGGVHVVYADLQAGGDIALVDVSEAGAIVGRRRASDDSLLAPQYDPHIASSGSGWSFLSWTDERTDWPGPAVHAAGRFAQAGIFVAPSFALASSTAASFQGQTDVAMRDDKTSAAVWIDDRSGSARAFLRRFDGTGAPLAPETALEDGSQSQLLIAFEQDPTVAIDSLGRIFTLWSAFDLITDSFVVLGQSWTQAGVRRGTNFVVSAIGATAEPVVFDAAAPGDGHVRLVWFAAEATLPAVKTVICDTNGAVGGPVIVSAEPVQARTPRVAVDTSGRWLVAWSQAAGTTEEILWQRFDAAGTPSAPIERISGAVQATRRSPAVAYSAAYVYGTWHGNEAAGEGFNVWLSSLLKAAADVRERESLRPDGFTLYANYPNPFNGGTRIAYQLNEPAQISLVIFDALGRRVKTLAAGRQLPGVHELTWDGRDERGRPLASGVYFCRLSAGAQADTRKLLYLK